MCTRPRLASLCGAGIKTQVLVVMQHFFFLIELSFPQKSLSQRKVSQYGWTVTGLYLLEKKSGSLKLSMV